MTRYKITANPTAFSKEFTKACMLGHPIGDLMGQAKQDAIKKRYTVTEKHVTKEKPVTITNDIDVRDIQTYELNPSHVDYESIKTLARESMLTYITNFVATRETYIYNSTDNLQLTCWKDFYLKYTHDINAYQQSYSLAKKVIDKALSHVNNSLTDYTMKSIRRDVWEILIKHHKGNELYAIRDGWIVTKILHKASQHNGIEFSQHMKQWQRGL